MSFPRLFAALLLLTLLGTVSTNAQSVVPQSPGQIKLSFAPVVKQVAPAVVNIYTRRTVRTNSPFANDPIFRQFFGQMGVPRDRVERSLGSGVIVRSDGTVITNNHVVAGADQITVVLSDRREFEATVKGVDERTDIAVLKINVGSEKLPTLPIGDSNSVEVGDVVLAVGDPFGVGQTVTMGIVSATARTAVGISDYRFFIQTDAAINPGNSGGALVGLDGRLIGINSEIYSQSGGSVGIGFAIPAAMVNAVLSSITTGGKTARPWLGASGQRVTADMYENLKLAHPEGVLVNSVASGSPAANGGIVIGDVITAINNQTVDDPEALRFRIGTLSSGTVAHVALIRAGRPMALDVSLSAPPDVPARQQTGVTGNNPLAGATVANLNPAVAEELSLPAGGGRGVVVMDVAQGSIAAQLGFKAGDIVVAINNQPAPSVSELLPVLANRVSRWLVTIRRDGKTVTFPVG